MKLTPIPEPKGYCSIYKTQHQGPSPFRSCQGAITLYKCKCDACMKWLREYRAWERVTNKEAHAAECQKWRESLGLRSNEIRVYGYGSTDQSFSLIDPPWCPETSTQAGATNCSCKVCP